MSKEKSDVKNINEDNVGSILYTISDIYKTAKQHIAVFVAIMIFCMAGYSGFALATTTPMYRTTATLSITPLIASDAKNGTSVYKFNFVSSFAEQMSETFPYVVESDNLRQAIQYDLGKPINAKITAKPVVKSNIIEVNVESDNANHSYEVMQSFLKTFPRLSEYIIGDTRINIIYQSRKPTEPFNEYVFWKNLLTGAVAGLIINIVLFYLWSLRVEIIHDKNDITYQLNSVSISELPHVNVKRNSKNKSGPSKITFTDSIFIEATRLARKRILSYMEEDDKILAVSATAKREGKTTVAFSLAKVFADNGSKTLLIDMDFSNRALQSYLLKAPDQCRGITDYVSGESKYDDAIKHYKTNFDIAFAGNKNVKYSNPAFAEFFKIARENYDYIIVDMPSCKLIPSAAAITDLCDDLLFVEKCNYSTITDIKNALTYVLYGRAKFIGFILNDYTPSGGSYGYGRYGYSRYGYTGGYRRYGYSYRYRHNYGYGYNSKYTSKYFEESEKKTKK
ncbi:MAG: AAA family ATPase [Clostridia bacterium]|nr:AAA family ATPase [Clostridia bacterium]